MQAYTRENIEILKTSSQPLVKMGLLSSESLESIIRELRDGLDKVASTEDKEERITRKKLAKRWGVTVRTLINYEKRNILTPIHISKGVVIYTTGNVLEVEYAQNLKHVSL